jgi:hypothetical protein
MPASKKTRIAALLVLVTLASYPAQQSVAQAQATAADAVLWTDPGNIQAHNLFWGPGGEKHQPQPPVKFEGEDTRGTSPKFDVRDSQGEKWRAKLGLEAKPETAASRLLWAVGYGANEDYFLARLEVTNLPPRLKRGEIPKDPGGDVLNVRLQRHPGGQKRVADWNWRKNPFYGTREFNGLRVLMGLIANWDLKEDNNAVFEDEKHPGKRLYAVSDVGTAFGTPGKRYSDKESKGNLAVFCRTKLIAHVHQDYIDLNFPKRPPLPSLFQMEWAFFFHQVRIGWIGKHIPRADAKWIGSRLAELSPDQIRDAFRAAGYSPHEVELYTQAVISRIQELNRL